MLTRKTSLVASQLFQRGSPFPTPDHLHVCGCLPVMKYRGDYKRHKCISKGPHQKKKQPKKQSPEVDISFLSSLPSQWPLYMLPEMTASSATGLAKYFRFNDQEGAFQIWDCKWLLPKCRYGYFYLFFFLDFNRPQERAQCFDILGNPRASVRWRAVRQLHPCSLMTERAGGWNTKESRAPALPALLAHTSKSCGKHSAGPGAQTLRIDVPQARLPVAFS